jgi:hypothetical protein
MKVIVAFVGVLLLTTTVSVAQQRKACHMIAGTDTTCTQSYASCITKWDPAKCRATRDSCLKTGRWIWRKGSECWDWGKRAKV